MTGFNPNDLMSRLEETKQEAISEEQSKFSKISSNISFVRVEKANFKNKMKNHYKGEFNMANLLK